MSSAICFNLDLSKILSSGNGLTLYHSTPNVKPIERALYMKTSWENKKILVTSFFSFSPNVLYLIEY